MKIKLLFQNFDNRKSLHNQHVIFYDHHTYSKLEEHAFIVENVVMPSIKMANYILHLI